MGWAERWAALRGGHGLFYHAIIYSSVVGETTTLRQTSINIRNPLYRDPYQYLVSYALQKT